jgi:GNAT superfamily N-acetyltransferase
MSRNPISPKPYKKPNHRIVSVIGEALALALPDRSDLLKPAFRLKTPVALRVLIPEHPNIVHIWHTQNGKQSSLKRGPDMIDAKDFKISDELKNGTPVTIRAVRPDDKQKINEAFTNLEPDTVYTRYFRYKNQLTDEELKWATELDFENDVALVVTIQEGDREVVIGGARYSVLKSDLDAPKRAEIAFTVEEDYQGQGIASRLLRRMAGIARDKGVSFFEAEVLSQNKPMLVVFERGGLPMKKKYEDGVIYLTMSLTEA